MPSATTTPNIGLQVAGFDQPNWQVPTNFNWNLLDLIFGGEITVPALSVTELTVGNLGALFAASLVSETPAGSVPGTTFTLSYAPGCVLGVYWNGLLLRPTLDYTIAGLTITTINSVTSGWVYAVYLR
jgi:hypothetical protein